MNPDQLLAAFDLPAAATVEKRVPKNLLLEKCATTRADKRLVNEGLEELRWIASLKPATCGVPEYRDADREYLEIAVLQMRLRAGARVGRLIELVHRAVPYPLVLAVDGSCGLAVSMANKRFALNELDRVVPDGQVETVELGAQAATIDMKFLASLSILRQPRNSLFALYQGWLDSLLALEAAGITGEFTIHDAETRLEQRRRALRRILEIQGRIALLRKQAAMASQMARQVEINLQLRALEQELLVHKGAL